MPEKTEQLEKLVTYLNSQKLISGALLTAEKEKPVFIKTLGKANVDTNENIHKETMFEIASLTKSFTGMAIMILQEQGKLDAQDLIHMYIPEFPYQVKGIKIHNLLTHTSGLPDYIEIFEEHWDRNRIACNKDIIEYFIENEPELIGDTDEKFEYSNTGYILLAEIIERLSGQAYGDFKDHIFDPLGMTRTRAFAQRMEEPIEGYAKGYIYFKDENRFELPDGIDQHAYVYFLDGAKGDGQVSSTVNDLYKWTESFKTNRLVKTETIKQIFQPTQLQDGRRSHYTYGFHSEMNAGYGYGWKIEKDEKLGKIITHDGYGAGYSSGIVIYPDHEITIIYMSNLDYSDGPLNKTHHEIMLEIENIMFNRPFKYPVLQNVKS
ncbi:serine hydrolase domain-containing protein [Pseudalkalibacillus salsuginis]|uniref:serine hydrolase domain-containing protein n=1 Tax=Pseudalkalibacillus salsuginis TaxID=2910972 RepID=UPI001F21C4D2|nr:serine hydrolase domain-containing protein [Pseudalkalibacillus salsuginis]MCF6409392.1 beta-lactamase family protein [Pseudalkalibacillus salsuginis]